MTTRQTTGRGRAIARAPLSFRPHLSSRRATAPAESKIPARFGTPGRGVPDGTDHPQAAPPNSGSMEAFDDIFDRLDQIRDDLDAGRLAMARRSSERVLRRIRRLRAPEAAPAEAEALTLLGYVLTELPDLPRARDTFEELLERIPTGNEAIDSEAWFANAKFRLAEWDFDGADESLARCEPTPNVAALAADLRGLLAMFAGKEAEAWRSYEEAARIDPEGCPMPTRLSDDDAHALLEEAVEGMPKDLEQALANVDIEMQPLPDPKVDRAPELHPEILGLYHGVPLTEKSVFDPVIAQDRIRVFKHNLERFSADRETLREELRITLLHEIGHHLGWDEDDLADRGLA